MSRYERFLQGPGLHNGSSHKRIRHCNKCVPFTIPLACCRDAKRSEKRTTCNVQLKKAPSTMSPVRTGLPKGTCRKGATLSRRYRSNGYVTGPVALQSRASPLPQRMTALCQRVVPVPLAREALKASQPFQLGHQIIQPINFLLIDFAALKPFDIHRQLGHATAFEHRPQRYIALQHFLHP